MPLDEIVILLPLARCDHDRPTLFVIWAAVMV